MIACRECGAPVTLKPAGQPGRQSAYCSDLCRWRWRQRDWRRRHSIERFSDELLVRLTHEQLSERGVDL